MVEYIDKWIAHANMREADSDDRHRRDTEQTRERSDVLRKEVSDANEKFRDL
jgi:hypothetical protein